MEKNRIMGVIRRRENDIQRTEVKDREEQEFARAGVQAGGLIFRLPVQNVRRSCR